VVALVIAACAGNTEESGSVATVPPDRVATTPSGTSGTVTRVLDGDSLIVAIDSEEREIRLIGVNAPEESECHGDEAKQALERLVAAGSLTLVADGEETDQYGRLLRYVVVDRRDVNRELLASGAAVALQSDHTSDAVFAAISDQAAADGLGLWAADACGSDAPLPSIVVTDYEYDPAGPDQDSLDEEWIEFANRGPATQDMAGWILRDESTQHRYLFPPGFTLTSDGRVTVHTGCGVDTATDLYWCSSGPVWSNGGDTVILQLPDGTVVARTRYSGRY
jgi:endonuclease YncB( thermonuclease family)